MENDLKDEVLLAGIQPCFHEVVRKYGREIFLLVYHSQLAGVAAQRLAEQARKRASRDIATATGILADSYNVLANLLAETQGWTPELLAEVDRAAQIAFQSSVQVPEPKIILQ